MQEVRKVVANKIEYAKWKLVAWRYLRVFLATFLITVGTNLSSIKNLTDILPLLIVPAITAALVSVGKVLRAYIGNGDYKSLIYKLPV